MLQRVDHYTSLARAVARLSNDSYEARGAVYDRALVALAKRLHYAVPPLSKVDIDMELLAFREAVRRVEFADLDYSSREAPHVRYHDAPPIAPWHGRANGKTRVAARGRRSVSGRVARRGVLAVLLLGLAGYFHAGGQIDLSRLVRLLNADVPGVREGPSAVPERAVFYEGTGAMARQSAARALWQTRFEGLKQEAVLSLDVQIPERGFSLTMSIRRYARVASPVSHLVEFRFAGTKNFAVEKIAGITGISMNGTALAGQSVKVAPGVFLFRLSGTRESVRRNAELLRTQPRLEIPIVFDNGSTAVLALDKGASGEQAFKEALNRWAQ